jgi:hypothetical protein
MRLARDCPSAKWLPARHHFALTRLIVYVCGRFLETAPTEVDRKLLVIDGDQSAEEIYGASLWIFITTACYIGATLPLPFGAAAALSFPLASFAVQIPTYVGGLIIRPLWNAARGTKGENNIKLNFIMLMVILSLASSYFATTASPVRWVAYFFLAVLMLNAAASLIMLALRDSVRELERRCEI